MFCPKCGQAVAEGAYFCPKCGADNSASVTTPAAGAQPGLQPVPPQQTSGLAIASLVCSLVPFLLLTPIVAVILGHVALSQIKKSAGRLKGSGLAIAGLVLGYCSFILVLLIIAAIAIPNLLRAKIAANEVSAAGAVRSFNTAEVTYSSMHPEKGYTCTLTDLKEAGIVPELANGTKNGYVFELVECKAENPGEANTKYQVIAYPVTKGSSGRRAFCSDESGVIRYDSSGSGQNCLDNGVTME